LQTVISLNGYDWKVWTEMLAQDVSWHAMGFWCTKKNFRKRSETNDRSRSVNPRPHSGRPNTVRKTAKVDKVKLLALIFFKLCRLPIQT